MKLERTASGYIIQVPDDVVAELGLHEGDDVRVARSNVTTLSVTEEQRAWALAEMKRLARPLPPGYRFDREEANAR